MEQLPLLCQWHGYCQRHRAGLVRAETEPCLLYTSDAADERSSVDLGGRRIIKKKKEKHDVGDRVHQ